jgi:hypothetical protein
MGIPIPPPIVYGLVVGAFSAGASKGAQSYLNKKEIESQIEVKLNPEELYLKCCKTLTVSP